MAGPPNIKQLVLFWTQTGIPKTEHPLLKADRTLLKYLGSQDWLQSSAPIMISFYFNHSEYTTVVEPYQLLCYWSNFSKLLLAGWFEVWPQRIDFHFSKQPMI